MELDEFRTQFIDNIRFEAEHNGMDPETKFIEQELADLEELGVLSDPIIMPIEMRGARNRLMSFDAYAYDSADSALVLIVSDFINERDSFPTITKTRIDELYTRMLNFIDESVNGNVKKFCDDADPAITLSKEFKNKIGKNIQESEILRFKFIIITNASLSKQVKTIEREDFLGRPCILDIWYLERFYQTYISNSSEIIEIETKDFGCNGIQCLKAEIGEEQNYDAYLGIVPGQFLAKIYIKYGSQLLQGNVRAFLSVRGKVNKGIRNTIINQPENFFTFNNGIAIVARSIRFSEDGNKIIYFKDPQIINGGQTTASLANVMLKKEALNGLDKIFVPMKLTVLNIENDMNEIQEEQYNKITKTISQCANSQNAVSDADFFSNHPFHVMMENLSKRVMAPPVNGKPYQTIWFYERSRGKWEQEQFKLTVAQKNDFCKKNPKNQVIKKEKLAKCYNSILMNPHQVCQSSAINFNYFAKYVENLYNNNKDSINEDFFKKCVCSVIIFDELDRLINKSAWYPKGGNKAQIVPYAIAKLMSLIPTNKSLDWKRIWQTQTLYPDLAQELSRIAFAAHEYLMDQAKGGIVRTISRNNSTWNGFRNYQYKLSDRFKKTLKPIEETKDNLKEEEPLIENTEEQLVVKDRNNPFNETLRSEYEIGGLLSAADGSQYNKESIDDVIFESYAKYLRSIKRGSTNKGISNAKPVLLLSILALIEDDLIKNNRIYYNSKDLEVYYELIFESYEPDKTPTPLYMPFYYLSHEPFYHLKWKNDATKVDTPTKKIIQENIDFAFFDEEFWKLLNNADFRAKVRSIIVEKYFGGINLGGPKET